MSEQAARPQPEFLVYNRRHQEEMPAREAFLPLAGSRSLDAKTAELRRRILAARPGWRSPAARLLAL
jgi:hypothetical protein